MEPRLYQLKNRIKYVDNLRSGRFKEHHGTWITHCGGVCAIGAAVLTMKEDGFNIRSFKPVLSPFNVVNYSINYADSRKERQTISDYFGLNYLEIKNISDKYEGFTVDLFITTKHLNHKQIADYIEEKHITPYMYMLGKYETKKTIRTHSLQRICQRV